MRCKLALFVLSVGIMAGCSKDKKEEKSITEEALYGTWKLIQYIDHANGGTDWTNYPEDVIYQKHITPTHFTWVRYEKLNDILRGIGGGTYAFENDMYTENIAFFLPPGSSESGQSIPFTVEIDEDGRWHHNGYAKRLEYDVDAGEMVVSDSVKIEEIWERVSSDILENDLTGTWNLESYRPTESDSLRSEYPSFVEYIKLLTPTHFVWIKYNGEGDEVMAAAGGTYDYQPGVYTENIEVSYPKGEGLVGTSPEFDTDLEADLWYHLGQVYRMDSAGGDPDTSLVDEIWTKALQ